MYIFPFKGDLVPSLVLNLSSRGEDFGAIERRAQEILIQSATPDAMSRLSETSLPKEVADEIFELYHLTQRHTSLSDFLSGCGSYDSDRLKVKSIYRNIMLLRCEGAQLVQIATNSRLLTNAEVEMEVAEGDVQLCSLQQFDTEGQFRKRIGEFVAAASHRRSILVLQVNLY